ncbi:hypothetical protein CEUSTIGMA_g1331.t1 [Chlamydomonas eustigma]|uniref:Uncharacterized protein n=1 Tax=Chlamydomonas eustigma TaxID=1157962 RepID=A0A250WSV7_9CHLO|nr:hypothetical protein CEUSTIGMA_g1331.t1 [Chlamydomonas eustigma]|eukprot:GAX73881.1 hypothetical protein CEUSTIGMA_g1331.t1 [Chlamydomonas eustigma]
MSEVVVEFVSTFVKGFVDDADEYVVQYLASALSQEQDGEIHLSELEDMLCSMSLKFSNLEPTRRLDLLTEVFCLVRDSNKSSTLQVCDASSSASTLQSRKNNQEDSPGSENKCATAGDVILKQSESDVAFLSRINELRQLCSCNLSKEYLQHLLYRHKQCVEATAEYILDCDDLIKDEEDFLRRREVEFKLQEEEQVALDMAKKSVLAKFDLQVVKPVGNGKKGGKELLTVEKKPQQDVDPKVRYHNGVPVHVRKGEKYVVEVVQEEWDGGSRGKVKTKGKRGKGFA